MKSPTPWSVIYHRGTPVAAFADIAQASAYAAGRPGWPVEIGLCEFSCSLSKTTAPVDDGSKWWWVVITEAQREKERQFVDAPDLCMAFPTEELAMDVSPDHRLITSRAVLFTPMEAPPTWRWRLVAWIVAAAAVAVGTWLVINYVLELRNPLP